MIAMNNVSTCQRTASILRYLPQKDRWSDYIVNFIFSTVKHTMFVML